MINYVNAQFKNSNNYTVDRLLQLFGKFDPGWRVLLEKYLEDNGRKEAITSIYSIRNKVAHGEDGGISIVRAKDYFEKITEVINFIASQAIGK